MNEYSYKWWFWGLAGAVLFPVILLAVDHFLGPRLPSGVYRPSIDAMFVAFAWGVGLVAVPALPVRPWLRMVLFFLYIPLFIYAVRQTAPWVPMG